MLTAPNRRIGRRVATAAAIGVLGCWLGACGGADEGGGSADQEQIEIAVRDVQRAFAAQDTERVCALLSRDGRKQIAAMGHGSEGPCYFDLYMFIEGVRKAPDWRKRTAREVRDVAIDGNRATATVVFEDGQTSNLPLVRERGAWRVDALYGGIPAAEQEDNY